MTPQEIIAKTKLRYSRLSTPVLADVRLFPARVPVYPYDWEHPQKQDGFKVVCYFTNGRQIDFVEGTLSELGKYIDAYMETDSVQFADRYIGG